MSDGLNQTHPHPQSSTAPVGPAVRRASRDLGPLVRAALLLGISCVAGVVGGIVWYEVWQPPQGVVVDGQWLMAPGEDNFGDLVNADATYALVALVVGLVLGAAGAWLLQRAEILSLLVVLIGAALAAYLILITGERVSPDPALAAAGLPEGSRLPADLSLLLQAPTSWRNLGSGWPLLLVAPMGALFSLGMLYLGTARSSLDHDPQVIHTR
jgi:ABC-type xylose transport system permease subunit